MANKKSAENLPGPGPGRPKGMPNKTTATLKEAILAAAEAVGNDGKGKNGLTGYLKHVASTDVKAFSYDRGDEQERRKLRSIQSMCLIFSSDRRL